MKHTRIDQLSDGIFAIVMTVLVFEINIPEDGVRMLEEFINDLREEPDIQTARWMEEA